MFKTSTIPTPLTDAAANFARQLEHELSEAINASTARLREENEELKAYNQQLKEGLLASDAAFFAMKRQNEELNQIINSGMKYKPA